MKSKFIKIKVPVSELSDTSKTLLALIVQTVSKLDRNVRKRFDATTEKAIGKKVLHVVEEYIEDVAEKMNEQGLFNEKEKDDA
jgi:hypothetical protein